jgi:hypothetical protein
VLAYGSKNRASYTACSVNQRANVKKTRRRNTPSGRNHLLFDADTGGERTLVLRRHHCRSLKRDLGGVEQWILVHLRV